MKNWKGALVALLLSGAAVPVVAASEPQAPAQAEQVVRSLKPQRGKIAIAEANATLDLGEAYDFYDKADARRVLVEIWGNPPASADSVLGLVMPAGASPLSDSWGAVVSYEDTGFVSDDDAADVDYGELLGQMREGEAERNTQRKQEGYPAIHLAGWAETPRYDAATHSVVWAQDLAFEETPVHTLNYDVRTLGRRGVLSINFISGMNQLSSIREAANAFTTHAAFDAGSRYADFDASTDKEAEYGIGGLVAAGVGVAAAKKLGLFAILLKFLKPILLAVVAGAAMLRGRIAALFGRKREPEAEWESQEPGE
ncbi:MAG TPA: DUF2167 domain-containing protein [Novosphingobium sp.]|nr:DUF2167 domain-containing protein [Novosphingobium sp.]